MPVSGHTRLERSFTQPVYFVSDTQVLVEGLGIGLAAKEFLQRRHLVLAATLLKHGVAIPAALFRIHRVFLEDAVEHIGRIDLR